MSTVPTTWADDDIHSFTTIFGTVLNGSEITWYNNPSTTATDPETDGTELKIRWV